MKRVLLTFVFLLSMFSAALPQDAEPQPRTVDPNAANGQWTRDQMREMQKKQAQARQQQLKADTAKLLQLATELKESVDKTNEHVLSLDVIKKSEEIEKLAKHIKTNMRDEVR